ncbi:hypothetical protein ACFWAT_00215 [Streptomyces syringium]|uniref:hypothetical protein n=1 Tax=Streptomyces syringium TaxID=76729 RepID=UPI00365298F0
MDESLRAVPLAELEGADGPGLDLFRDSCGPGLLVPAAHRGLGATALEALRVQRALGARAPWLAATSALHHLSTAVLLAQVTADRGGLEWMLVEGVAADNRLVAFGFAEGRPDAGMLAPVTTATMEPEGLRIGGVTRTCGLAGTMDLLAISVMTPRTDGKPGENRRWRWCRRRARA